MPPVDPQQLADAADAELQRLAGRIMREYRKSGRVSADAIASAVAAGLDPMKAVVEAGAAVRQAVRAGMTLAHVAGAETARKAAGVAVKLPVQFNPPEVPDPGSFAPLDRAVEFLRKRAKLSPAAIRRINGAYDNMAATAAKGFTDRVSAVVNRTVAKAIQQGLHTRQAAEVVRTAMERAGAGKVSQSLAETLFRTNASIAHNAGRAEFYESIDSEIWGYEYLTVGDERVRPAHAALHGTRYAKDNPRLRIIWPPAGFNCRCQMVPIFIGERRRMKENLGQPFYDAGDGELKPVQPDPGFAFNPLEVLRRIEAL